MFKYMWRPVSVTKVIFRLVKMAIMKIFDNKIKNKSLDNDFFSLNMLLFNYFTVYGWTIFV